MAHLNYFEDRDDPFADALDVGNRNSFRDIECGYGARYSGYWGSWTLSLGKTGAGHG